MVKSRGWNLHGSGRRKFLGPLIPSSRLQIEWLAFCHWRCHFHSFLLLQAQLRAASPLLLGLSSFSWLGQLSSPRLGAHAYPFHELWCLSFVDPPVKPCTAHKAAPATLANYLCMWLSRWLRSRLWLSDGCWEKDSERFLTCGAASQWSFEA